VPHCPAAESLENTLMRFSDHFSYEPVVATAVDGANRHTSIQGTLQEVGSVFVQLAVFSSGCPVGKRVRPLLRDMRPFTTNNELTRFLVSKMLLKNRGDIEAAREEVKSQVEPLHEVFSNLWKRMDHQPPGGDAVQNSIVRMDAFTMNVSLQLDEILTELINDMGWDEDDELGIPPVGSGPEPKPEPKPKPEPEPVKTAPPPPPLAPPERPTALRAEPPPPKSVLARLRDLVGWN
jgi:hypothetical protein